MISRTLKLNDVKSMQIAEAKQIVAQAEPYKCSIIIRYDGKEFNAKSIMMLIAAGFKSDTELEIICNGENEQQALAQTAAAIEQALKKAEA